MAHSSRANAQELLKEGKVFVNGERVTELGTKINPEINRELINKIYKEGKESFVIFILEMKFIEGLNFFNGQIKDEEIIAYFKKNTWKLKSMNKHIWFI